MADPVPESDFGPVPSFCYTGGKACYMCHMDRTKSQTPLSNRVEGFYVRNNDILAPSHFYVNFEYTDSYIIYKFMHI